MGEKDTEKEQLEEEFSEEDEEEEPKLNYDEVLDNLLSKWCERKTIQKDINDGKFQKLIYHYKDLISEIGEIIKKQIKFLISQFEKSYNKILKQNIRNLRLAITPTIVVDTGVEKFYKRGLEILNEFYDTQLLVIERPFIDSLLEISDEDSDDLVSSCQEINFKLAETTKHQFRKLKAQLEDIRDKIYKNIDKFHLEILPKSISMTIHQFFSESVESITEKMNNWVENLDMNT